MLAKVDTRKECAPRSGDGYECTAAIPRTRAHRDDKARLGHGLDDLREHGVARSRGDVLRISGAHGDGLLSPSRCAAAWTW